MTRVRIQPELRMLAAAAALLLSGCLAAPKPASKILPEPVTQNHEQGIRTDLVMPAGYWSSSGPADAARVLQNCQRAVVSEFAIELIDLQSVGPLERQMAVNPPPMIFGPLVSIDGLVFIGSLSVNILGLGRNNLQMSDDKQLALAGSLFNAYEADLLRRGLAVVPTNVLLSCPSYTKLKPQPVSNSSFFRLLNPMGSDTGVVLRTRMTGAPSLGVVTCGVFERTAAEEKLLHETGADVSIAIRLRVGSFHKKAALEQGSTIRLTTAEGATVFTAKRSILSDNDVIGEPRFKVFTGHIEPVQSEDFIRELSAMLPKFLELCLREPVPTVNQQPRVTRLPPVDGTLLR